MVDDETLSSTSLPEWERFGGAEGIRTPDPLHAMQVRYQLRHSPAECDHSQTTSLGYYTEVPSEASEVVARVETRNLKRFRA